jgi:hypothetical protein
MNKILRTILFLILLFNTRQYYFNVITTTDVIVTGTGTLYGTKSAFIFSNSYITLTWGNDKDVAFQSFNLDGTIPASGWPTNLTNTPCPLHAHQYQSIAVYPNGDFVIVWKYFFKYCLGTIFDCTDYCYTWCTTDREFVIGWRFSPTGVTHMPGINQTDTTSEESFGHNDNTSIVNTSVATRSSGEVIYTFLVNANSYDVWIRIRNAGGGAVQSAASPVDESGNIQDGNVATERSGGFMVAYRTVFPALNLNSKVVFRNTDLVQAISGSFYYLSNRSTDEAYPQVNPYLLYHPNSGKIAVCYNADYGNGSGHDVYFTVFDSTASFRTISDIQFTNYSGDQGNCRLVLLQNNYIGMSWVNTISSSSHDIRFQVLTMSGTKYGVEQIITDSTMDSMWEHSLSSDGGVTVAFTWNYGGTTNMRIFHINHCADFNTLVPYSILTALTFTGIDTGYSPYLVTKPNTLYGKTYSDSAGTISVTANTGYTVIYYDATSLTVNSFTFKGDQIYDITCTVTIYVCFTTCATCTIVGNSIYHQCDTCNNAAGYYQHNSYPGNCYNTSAPETDRYYVDTTASPQQFKPCYASCKKCSGAGTSTAHNCITGFCNTNYYPKSPFDGNCYTATTQMNTWLYVSGVFRKCYSTCLTCSASILTANSSTNKCILCLPGNYMKVNDGGAGNCFPQSPAPTGYFFDNATSLFQQCYANCLDCYTYGTTADMQCSTCQPGYYKLEDCISQCVNSLPTGYVFSGSMYYRCYSTCSTCSQYASSTVPSYTLCTTCIAGYAFKSGHLTPDTCYDITSSVSGYYYSSGTGLFQPCDPACSECNGPNLGGTPADTNCKVNYCKTGSSYYPLFDAPTKCFLSSASPSPYVFLTNQHITCYTSCSGCSGVGTTTNHMCTTCKFPAPPGTQYASVNGPGFTGMCFDVTSTIAHYYYDSATTKFQPCYRTCLQCSSFGVLGTPHHCTTCDTTNGFYPVASNVTNCFKQGDTTDVPPANLYFDSLYTFMWQNCYMDCATCTTGGNINVMNCTSCNLTTLFPVQGMSNCYASNYSLTKYVFKTNIFLPCDTFCKNCSDVLVGSNSNCNSCIPGYAPAVDLMTNCYNINSTLNKHFYDNASGLFQLCYTNCLTCVDIDIPGDMRCLTCDTGFYPVPDTGNASTVNCYDPTANVQKYYFDISTNTFQQCYISCLYCTTGGNSSVNNCKAQQCDNANNYYYKIDQQTQCYLSSTIINGYFFNVNFFDTCYATCNGCNGIGTPTANNCIACIANTTYSLEDDPTMCYYPTDIVSTYTFHNNQFSHCYVSCGDCSAFGISTAHYCLTCKFMYYQLVDDSTFCYETGELVPSYYFNADNKLFEHCYTPCKYCDKLGDESNHQCKECAADYYPLSDNPLMCYPKTTVMDLYVFQDDKNMFMRCYQSCRTCKSAGNNTDHKCIDCLISGNYFPLEDRITQCYEKDSQVNNYYYDAYSNRFKHCFYACISCAGSGDLKVTNCLTCDPTYADCQGCDKIIYNSKCIDKCPDDTIYDNVNNTCINCSKRKQLLYNNQCVSTCPDGCYENSGKCIACADESKVWYSGQCYYQCPAGTTTELTICKDIPDSNAEQRNVLNNQYTCLADTCWNGGTCSVNVSIVECTCKEGFFGTYCEYKLDSQNFGVLKSNFNYYNLDNVNYITSPLTNADKKILSDIMSVIKTNPNLVTMDLAEKLYALASNIKF